MWEKRRGAHSWILAFCISLLRDCCRSLLSLSDSLSKSACVCRGSIDFAGVLEAVLIGLEEVGGVVVLAGEKMMIDLKVDDVEVLGY